MTNDNPFLKLMARYRDDPVAFAREVIGMNVIGVGVLIGFEGRCSGFEAGKRKPSRGIDSRHPKHGDLRAAFGAPATQDTLGVGTPLGNRRRRRWCSYRPGAVVFSRPLPRPGRGSRCAYPSCPFAVAARDARHLARVQQGDRVFRTGRGQRSSARRPTRAAPGDGARIGTVHRRASARAQCARSANRCLRSRQLTVSA